MRTIEIARGWSTSPVKRGWGVWVHSGGPIESVPESVKCLSRRGRQEFTAVCAARKRDIGRRENNQGKCIPADARKNGFTMRTVKPWKRVLLPAYTHVYRIRIFVWWATSPDPIAVPALRGMTCPCWIAVWFTWCEGESLPNSDFPKTVERSFLFLQLWVQGDRQYNPSSTCFCLFTFGIIHKMMMKEPQQSLSLRAVAKLTEFLKALPPKGKYPQILQAVLHQEYKRNFIWI